VRDPQTVVAIYKSADLKETKSVRLRNTSYLFFWCEIDQVVHIDNFHIEIFVQRVHVSYKYYFLKRI
jgi:hypothetical protein